MIDWKRRVAYASIGVTDLVVLDREEHESVGVLLKDGLVGLVALDTGSSTGLCFLGLGQVVEHGDALDWYSDLIRNHVLLLF